MRGSYRNERVREHIDEKNMRNQPMMRPSSYEAQVGYFKVNDPLEEADIDSIARPGLSYCEFKVNLDRETFNKAK